MRRTDLFRRAATAPLIAAMALLSACATPKAGADGLYARPIGDAPVTQNPTPYSQALVCLADWARANGRGSPRIAVGRIADYTGKLEPEGGTKVTQGGSLMAISALAKAGARLVERYDTSVAEMELKYANNKLITDAPVADPSRPNAYRPILPGAVAGSTYYLVGGVTELNFNIRSSGADALAGQRGVSGPKGSFTSRTYVMNAAVDLRLVDSRTFEVVDVVSYQKQIVGREISAGVFSFLGGSVIDVSAGQGGLEPLQLAVRSLIERGTLEMMANLYGAPGPQVCLSPAGDPLQTREPAPGAQAHAAPASVGGSQGRRLNPAAWSGG